MVAKVDYCILKCSSDRKLILSEPCEFLALWPSPTYAALLKVSWSVRGQWDVARVLARRRCVSSRMRDVESSSRLFCCILSRSRAKLVR